MPTMIPLHPFTLATLLTGSLVCISSALSPRSTPAIAFATSRRQRIHVRRRRGLGLPYCEESQYKQITSTTTCTSFRPQESSESDSDESPDLGLVFHTVDGIKCREVIINVDGIGPVVILEATADSQEALVDMALALEGEEEGGESNGSSARLNAGDPYGSVLWPAASAVANHLMKSSSPNPTTATVAVDSSLQGQGILELGTGTGLVSIAAALGGARSVISTDYESVPLRLLEYAASELNPTKKSVDDDGCSESSTIDLTSRIRTEMLDICDFDTPMPEADLVCAADIMYEPMTGRAMAHRTVEALRRGSRVVIGCSPGRPGRPAFLEELKRLVPGIRADFADAEGTTCSGPRHDLICGEGSTSVSEKPKMLLVAIMDLDPSCLP